MKTGSFHYPFNLLLNDSIDLIDDRSDGRFKDSFVTTYVLKGVVHFKKKSWNVFIKNVNFFLTEERMTWISWMTWVSKLSAKFFF